MQWQREKIHIGRVKEKRERVVCMLKEMAMRKIKKIKTAAGTSDTQLRTVKRGLCISKGVQRQREKSRQKEEEEEGVA